MQTGQGEPFPPRRTRAWVSSAEREGSCPALAVGDGDGRSDRRVQTRTPTPPHAQRRGLCSAEEVWGQSTAPPPSPSTREEAGSPQPLSVASEVALSLSLGQEGVCLHTELVGRVLGQQEGRGREKGQHELRPTHCSDRASPRQPSETPQAALRSSARPSTVSPPRHDTGMVGSCSLAAPSSNGWAKPGQRSHGQGRCCGSCLFGAGCFCRAGGTLSASCAQMKQPHETHPGRWRLWRDPPVQPPMGELRLVSQC